jgi:hypothetical protein
LACRKWRLVNSPAERADSASWPQESVQECVSQQIIGTTHSTTPSSRVNLQVGSKLVLEWASWLRLGVLNRQSTLNVPHQSRWE